MKRRVSFSDESILAIAREDRPKTVTRRLVTPARLKIAAGDRLQVLEVHAFPAAVDRKTAAQIAEFALAAGYRGRWCPTWYRADDWYNNAILLEDANGKTWGGCGRWRAGRYLPAWAVRTELEVVSATVERLQSIEARDRRAEVEMEGYPNLGAFIEAWERLNPHTWATNPEVVRIEFRRIRP